jgi:hypothetical protein
MLGRDCWNVVRSESISKKCTTQFQLSRPNDNYVESVYTYLLNIYLHIWRSSFALIISESVPMNSSSINFGSPQLHMLRS